VKILAISNLYPPHHAGSSDLHCPTVLDALRTRGHVIQVLTSTHGLKTEQRDGEIQRRLWLNGAYGYPLIEKYGALKELEARNNQALAEAAAEFQPEVILVFCLRGISKSLIWSVRSKGVRVVYDVSDDWLANDIKDDPWLRFWNSPSLPFFQQSTRAALEVSGERGRADAFAPTRKARGFERIPALFGDAKTRAATQPNSIEDFRFENLYFCGEWLKKQAEAAGFRVSHAEVIRPGISTQAFIGDVKPPSAPVKNLLIAAELNDHCGVMTALKALKIMREARLNAKISIYGRGNSSYIAEIRSFIAANQLPVDFLSVSNVAADAAAVYKRHDALLHTSEFPESFPIAPLEAMACGLPVIGTALGGAAEILRNGETGLTYTPGDADQLAARVQELQVSPAFRCQMAETAQQEVLNSYNEVVVTDKIEDYITHTARPSEALLEPGAPPA